MTGRPPWSQPGTDGGGQTVAVQNRPELVSKDYNQGGDLASNETEKIEIYAPEGSIYQVMAMRLEANIPESASDGMVRLDVSPMSHIRTLVARSTYTESKIWWNHSQWMSPNDTELPSDASAQYHAMSDLIATSDSPITVRVENMLDVDITSSRSIQFIFEVSQY